MDGPPPVYRMTCAKGEAFQKEENLPRPSGPVTMAAAEAGGLEAPTPLWYLMICHSGSTYPMVMAPYFQSAMPLQRA